MNKILWNAIKQSPGILGAVFLLANAALAIETQPAGQDSVISAQSSSDAQVLEQPVSLPTEAAGEAPAQVLSLESTLVAPEGVQFQLAQVENEPQPDAASGLEQVNSYAEEATDAMDQVTSVSQLSDVQPTDWAFQALQSLVERYGCIAGYPDGTYKGNRAMTRFEFAAGLNACLERVNELIAASTANLVTREDLAVLQRLQEEFAAELAALRGRVLALEARTAELEANQFSTTTKLNGEIIFFAGDTFGDRSTYNVNGNQGFEFDDDNDDDDDDDDDDEFNPGYDDPRGLVEEDDDPTQTFFGYRVRLNFDTSFTGEDLLRTRLQVANLPNLSRTSLNNTLMTRLSTDGGDGGFELDDLYYRFPVLGNGQVFIGANSLDLDDLNQILNPLQSTGAGVASRFGRYNPLTARGPQGVGAMFRYSFEDLATVTVGYLTGDGADASDGRGLFNGSYSASAQVAFEPFDDFGVAVEYSHRYFREDNVDVSGGTGSFIARRPFGNGATSSDNLGIQANWGIADWFEIGGWFGVAWAQEEGGGDRDATILNGAVTLAFPDLLNDGDLGGILVGVPPIVVNHDVEDLEDRDSSIHIEAFYRFQVNDYISVTPGVFVVTNPDHNEDNDTTVVGTLRTQFRF
ncbi:MAG: iron uptake porin [Microcoleaceae cyanobacterium]